MSKSNSTINYMRFWLALKDASVPESDPNCRVPFTDGCRAMGLSRDGYKAKWKAQKAAVERGEAVIEALLPDRLTVDDCHFFFENQVELYVRAFIAHGELEKGISTKPWNAVAGEEG
jgi:hypothetical protein